MMTITTSVCAAKQFPGSFFHTEKFGVAVLAILLLFGFSGAGLASVPSGVAECWDDIVGVYQGDLTGTAAAGAESDGTSVSGNDLVVDGSWMFNVGADGSLIVLLGGGMTADVPLIMGMGTVNMDTGYVDMLFTIPLIEELLGDSVPPFGFSGAGLFDCAGNFSFAIPDVGFSLSGTLTDVGASSGIWAFDFFTILDSSVLNPGVEPVLVASIQFLAGGTFSGGKDTAPADGSPVILASSKGSGVVSPAGTVAVAEGADQAFVFTPGDGCDVLDVLVDGASIGAVTGYTFENVTANHTLEVRFGSATLWNDIPGVYAGELQGTLTIPGTFKMNDVEIPWAPALQGSWVFNVGADGSLIITINGGLPITLAPGDPPIPANLVGIGTVDTQTGAAEMVFNVPHFGPFNGTGLFTCDRQVSFAIPELGYSMNGTLNEDGSVDGVWNFDSSLFFVSFSAGGTFSGELTAPDGGLLINAAARGAGAVSPAGVITVENGGSQAFVFTPGGGCEILDVLVDGSSIGAVAGYTFENVTENHSLEVVFGSPSLWAVVPGNYNGGFNGEATDPILFPVEGTWSFTVESDASLSIVVNGPTILGAFGTITGAGVVDPLTGRADIVFTIPIHGNAAGTGQFDCQGGFAFDVPGLGFSMSGQTQAGGGITGTWTFDSALLFVKIAAGGGLTDSNKYALPQNIRISAIGAGTVQPFEVENETTDVKVEKGGSPALSFVSEGGCQVLDVVIDGVSVGPVTGYTFESIAADHTVEVKFGSETIWENIPGIYTGALNGKVSYSILGSDTQIEPIDGSWEFNVGADGQLDIIIHGLPVVGDVLGTGKIEDLRTGYAPMTFSLSALDAILGGLAALVPASLPGYGQFYCDNTLYFKMSFFGVTMIMQGEVGDDGWAFGSWNVNSSNFFVKIDGQGEFYTDIDNDNLPDGWEVENGLDPLNPDDAAADADNDGLTAAEEYALGTSPVKKDTDGDNMPDGWEVDNGLNPLAADADGDPDGDGLINWYEYKKNTDPNTVTAGPGIPETVSPADGASLVSLTPTLTVAYQEGFGGDLHAASVWQVAVDETFAGIVFETTSDTALLELLLPGAMLAGNTAYAWRAQFVDSDGWDWLWSAPASFTTDPAPFVDADGNNIPDNQDVTDETDLNDNGINDGEEDMARVLSPDGTGQISLTTGDENQAIAYLEVNDPDSLPQEGRPAGLTFPFGLISFRLTVENPGDTATVTVFFSEPLAEAAVWYKYDSVNGWQDFSAQAQFSVDLQSVILTLIDGGAGDADGVANGVIVDPSGPAVTDRAVEDDTPDDVAEEEDNVEKTGSSGGGDGGLCFISTAGVM